MADVAKQVLGPVSAYALAKQQGYSGTLEEWAQDQANAGANAAAAKKSAEDAAAILEQIKENNKSYDEEINKLKALKPEDIGAQPAGDYALKNEIPAPYTLPTATADTLGGVKSSEAVTVNADGTMTVNQLNGKDASEYALKTDLTGGDVQTVNGVAPDETGNVQLTAGNVGARPDTWTPSAQDVGALPSDGTAADSAKLDGKDSVYYHKKFSHPRNLLDNSDFTNPVNKRGQTSYTGNGYTIDRWRTTAATTSHELTSGGIKVFGSATANHSLQTSL